MYDLILFNNSTRETTLKSGVENISTSHLYLQFDNVELDLPDGEYTVVCFVNNRDDVTYDFTIPILDSIAHTEEGDVQLKYLDPIVDIMRIGRVEEVNKYDKTDKLIFYGE